MIGGRRAAFAVALSTVAGVAGYRARPSTPKTGDAWPILGPAERDDASGQFLFGWNVAVYLPQDRDSADVWIDSHLDELVDALEGSGTAYVEGITPANLGDDNSPIYGLLISTRSE